jgi:hypothetical protein
MYARVTLLEIDAVRVSVDTAVELFRTEVLPRMCRQPGYEGVYVLTTTEGKGAIVSLWGSEEAAAGDGGWYAEELARYATLFRSPPGRETYEVVLSDLPASAYG